MRFPPRPDGPVAVSIMEPAAPHPFARSQLTLNRATADVVKWEPYSENNLGRRLRSWFRGLHTGEALGFFGQTVAGLASLGGCFLVWTGLAMAWRRFRSWRRTPVEIASTSEAFSTTQTSAGHEATYNAPAQFTSEPDDISRPQPANGHKINPPGGEMISGYESITILYGTVMGNAESVAHQTAANLRRAGLSVRVSDMAHCQASSLTRLSSVLIVTSTYGNGEPPDDIIPFWQAVVHGNGLDLRGLKFSVLALGNTTYDHFCQCGREFDLALERHGATRFYPRVDCDADYETPARRWIDGVIAALQRPQAASAWASMEKKWSELESAS
jgi:sulfite reductase (NADPH) flavoprotein alpha-component